VVKTLLRPLLGIWKDCDFIVYCMLATENSSSFANNWLDNEVSKE
jgi:hypothetical protein